MSSVLLRDNQLGSMVGTSISLRLRMVGNPPCGGGGGVGGVSEKPLPSAREGPGTFFGVPQLEFAMAKYMNLGPLSIVICEISWRKRLHNYDTLTIIGYRIAIASKGEGWPKGGGGKG